VIDQFGSIFQEQAREPKLSLPDQPEAWPTIGQTPVEIRIIGPTSSQEWARKKVRAVVFGIARQQFIGVPLSRLAQIPVDHSRLVLLV